jgi:plasmid stabilization system protein ParE
MKYQVLALRRAEADVRHITRWLSQRSPQGAISWLDAYQQLIERLAKHADSCASALENADCNPALKQALFGTRSGRAYRAVFTIVGDQVRILRVRGPGQPPLQDDELS